jgi:hypothetical protein
METCENVTYCACVYEIRFFSSAKSLQKLSCFRLSKPKRTESRDFHPRILREVAPALTPKYQDRTASKLMPSWDDNVCAIRA